jgi:hypothetical protein
MEESGQSRTVATNGAAGGRVERIERNEAGQLVAHLAGRDEPLVDARIVRCFPWSVPDNYLSVRDADGKEVAMLGSLDALDSASRGVAEGELAEKVFNPKIIRVVDFKDEFSVTSITAETDRGEVTFQIRSREDVRILSPTRALFRDVDGNTYELPDLSALDNTGRRYLDRYF